MVADTYDPILGFILQGTGNNNNTWGDTFNNSATKPIARAIGGLVARAVTGGTLDVSGSPPPATLRQDIDYIQNFTGVLTSDETFIVPNLSKSWLIANNTTGAFNLYIKTTAGTATQIPQGTTKLVYGDGSNGMFRTDKEHIGSFRTSGKATAGSGELACNGASLLRTTYPDLFAAIGTTWGAVDGTHFTLPLLTDTNRYLRAGGGAGPAVGTYQSSQNLAHTHTVTGAPGLGTLTTDVQGAHTHTINVSDPTHVHAGGIFFSGGYAGGGNSGVGGPVNTGAAATGISATSVSAGSHGHNIIGAPSVGSLGTASSGGTEARPESAAVLICIVY